MFPMSLSTRNALFFSVFLALDPSAVFAQGRAQQPAQTTNATPAGRGRGAASGPGPAIGGDADETPIVTKHSITVDGKPLSYTATVAQMPLKDASGEAEAHIFYMAYTLDEVTDTAQRPLTFCFNGGPGSASM